MPSNNNTTSYQRWNPKVSQLGGKVEKVRTTSAEFNCRED